MKWLQVLLFNINYFIQHNSFICDTMWVVRQADDPFVCFGAKPNKKLGFDISDETGSVGGKWGPWEARGQLAMEPRVG